MKIKEIRDMEADALKNKFREFKEEYFNLRFQLKSGQLEKTHALKRDKKDIAKVFTVINEKTKSSKNKV